MHNRKRKYPNVITTPQVNVKNAEKDDLTLHYTFQYDDHGAIWVGRIQNKSDTYSLNAFSLELYITF